MKKLRMKILLDATSDGTFRNVTVVDDKGVEYEVEGLSELYHKVWLSEANDAGLLEGGGMNDISKKRAEKMADSREWSCLDALEDTIAGIKDGTLKPSCIAIHMFDINEDGRTHHFQIAGLTYPEHIALLTLALDRVVSEWRK